MPWETSEAPDTATAYDALLEALDAYDGWELGDEDPTDPRAVVLVGPEGPERFPNADAAHQRLLEEDGGFGPGGEHP